MPVKVAQATVQPPLSFRLDVMPVFMRAGCNTGSCHGAARGKDGFRISLFGFDPEGDHFRLTREMVGRRINLAVPSDSTLLEKGDRRGAAHRAASGSRPSSELYQTLHGWIEAGAPNDDVSQAAQGRRRRPLSQAGRARRQGLDPAADRPGPVLRRHRPRRDQPGRLPDQQRRLGRRSARTDWSPPASAARRS